MKRKHKLYVKPKKPFEKVRIEEENSLLAEYGLKKKREIWKTSAKVDYFRRRAKALAKSSLEEQEVLFKKLQALGLKVSSIADVLALTVHDLLRRRLQTLVFRKQLSNTMNHSRQLIAHKRIFIDSKVVDVPGYLVSVEEEKKISLKQGKQKPHAEENKEDSK